MLSPQLFRLSPPDTNSVIVTNGRLHLIQLASISHSHWIKNLYIRKSSINITSLAEIQE
jgi:hypothetical protein